MRKITLAAILKDKREKSCMTSGEMAGFIGISRMTYSKLENGKANPSIAVIRRLAVALNTTPEYIKSLIN